MDTQQLDDLHNQLFTDNLNQASSKDLLQDSTEFDVDLRSQLLQKSPESFRICNDKQREGFKKLSGARDKRALKLPSLEARQSQGL